MTERRAPKRIQMSRQHPWRADNPDAVIVSRPSRWGNPFKVGRRHMRFPNIGWGPPTSRPVGPVAPDGWVEVVEIATRADAVEMYRAWLRSCLTTFLRPLDLAPLRGRDLACWCPLDQPCHADVLLELANGDPE